MLKIGCQLEATNFNECDEYYFYFFMTTMSAEKIDDVVGQCPFVMLIF